MKWDPIPKSCSSRSWNHLTCFETTHGSAVLRFESLGVFAFAAHTANLPVSDLKSFRLARLHVESTIWYKGPTAFNVPHSKGSDNDERSVLVLHHYFCCSNNMITSACTCSCLVLYFWRLLWWSSWIWVMIIVFWSVCKMHKSRFCSRFKLVLLSAYSTLLFAVFESYMLAFVSTCVLS